MAQSKPQHYRNYIRHYRRKRKLRLQDVVNATGHVSPANLAHWEKGRKTPSLPNALKLAAALECPVEVLFFDMYHSYRRSMPRPKRE
jgi:DNA-binding XRE family transcriptional regulator